MTRFVWHPEKAEQNWRKHRVRFEEAATIFGDESILTRYDDDHSANEERWVSMGRSIMDRILVVVHLWPADNNGDEVIRLISARRANARERKTYLDSK